jgi:hypothetical protein
VAAIPASDDPSQPKILRNFGPTGGPRGECTLVRAVVEWFKLNAVVMELRRTQQREGKAQARSRSRIPQRLPGLLSFFCVATRWRQNQSKGSLNLVGV